MPNLTLYYTPMSSSTRVQWALEELEIPYEKLKVNLKEGEQKRPEYLKLNPNGKVPTLVIDGTPIFESMAMLMYLGETFGVEKGVYPPLGVNRAEVYQWMVWSGVTLSDPLMRFFRNKSERFPAEQRNDQAAESALKELHGLLGIAEGVLTSKSYLVGNSFSFADIALASFFSFMGRLGVDTKEYPNLVAWADRCTQRPAYKRATSV